ncbi:hypothetical protein MASR2M29_17900 [Spirochaetota bacterium]
MEESNLEHTESNMYYKQRYEELVHALPDIVYELNPDGVITFISESVFLIGYTPDELVGKHFSVMLDEDDAAVVDRDKVLQEYAGLKTGDGISPKLFNERRGIARRTWDLEVKIKRKPGKRYNTEEFIGSVTAYGEISAAGSYSRDGKRIFRGTVGIIRDVTLKRKSEEMLRKLYQAVDQIPVGVFILDRGLLVNYVNPAFFLYSGFSPADIIGKDLFALLNIPDKKSSVMKSMLYAGFDSQELININTKSGTRLWMDFSMYPVRSLSGVITHAIVVADNINSRIVMEEALDKANADRLKAEQEKACFLESIGRDLKTPLLNIINSARLLQADRADKIADDINSNANALMDVFKGMLDYIIAENRPGGITEPEFSFVSFMEEVCGPYTRAAEKKGMAFNPGAFPDVELRMEPERLRRILEIVLDEAFRLADGNSVQLVSFLQKQNGKTVSLKIKATAFFGNNAPEEKLADAGLLLAKRILESMGGSLKLDDSVMDGKAIVITLPPDIISGSKDAYFYETVTEKEVCERYSLLLVDDNEVYLEYIRTLLENLGYQVYCAIGAAEALKLLETHIIDVALLDILMPGYSGLELAKVMRSYHGIKYSSKMPIFALSGMENLTNLDGGVFDEVFDKPFDINKLSGTILSYMEKLESQAVAAINNMAGGNSELIAKTRLEAQTSLSVLEIALKSSNIIRIDIKNEAIRLKKLLALFANHYMTNLASMFIEHYSIDNRKMLLNILARLNMILAKF